MIAKGLAALAQALAAKEISSVELTQLYLDRIARLNPKINAFITVDAAGYDAGKVILWRGGSTPPRSLTVDGRTAWPAYLADPAVVPEKAGARWIFPMVEDGTGQHSSPLPPHGRVVGGSTPGFATPYVVPEAQAMLDRFRSSRGG